MSKGFTLVELLAVIAIIAILLMLTVPFIGKYLITAKTEFYQQQIENIKSGAKGWAANNLSSLPVVNGDYITIYLGELKILGLIKEDIKNPITKELFLNDMEIVILREDDDYVYLVDPGTGTGTNNFDSLAPTVVLRGQSNEETEINEPYVDKGLIITDRFGKKITNYRTIIKSNSVVVSEVDTSRFGMYDITYQIDYIVGVDSQVKTLEVYRTVEVTDTKNPVITMPESTYLELFEVATFNAMNGVSVTDNSLEVLTINVAGNISAIPGIYVITYSATDSSGNTATVLRNVEVVAPKWTFEVTIPGGSLNFAFAAVSSSLVIQWGDGSVTPFNGTGYPLHNYAAPGVYEVTLNGTASKISFCDTTGLADCSNATPTKLSDILTVIPIEFGLTDATAMFTETTVASFSKLDFFDEASANITDMSYMFADAYLFNHPIGNWNTSNVTDMFCLLCGATVFNQPVGNWDTSNVTNMSYTFAYTEAFNQPLNTWDTSNVDDMDWIFDGALVFNQPLSNWDTSGLNSMIGIFSNAASFNQSVNTWNVSNVTTLNSMFYGATVFNQPLDAWNTSNVTDMRFIFYRALAFNKPLATWNTAKLIKAYAMFRGASSFNQPLSAWSMSNVVDMYQMFREATAFNQPIGNWNISKAVTMYQIFLDATSFNQPLATWNTSNATTMYEMFRGASSFNQPIGTWNTAKVTNMWNMFHCSSNFNQNISTWNTSNVTNMVSMFECAASFNQNLSNWCVTKIAVKPTNFDTDAIAWTLAKPIWGTCP